MQLEFHQLELRYADLRIHDPGRVARLMGSLATQGQQVPVIVVAEDSADPAAGSRHVLIDGHLRVAALKKLGHDTVEATPWPVSELDALLLHHHLSLSSRSAFEQAWFLTRLQEQGLSQDDIARRLCRTKSWVSRRLSLVRALPDSAQQKVRAGQLPPHAASKYLVPLARANKTHCENLVTALGAERLSDRDVATLYEGWRRADTTGKLRICQAPSLYLRAARADAASKKKANNQPGPNSLISELGIIGAVAWRARQQLGNGVGIQATYQRSELNTAWNAAETAFNDLARTLTEALTHAGSDDPDSHSGAA